MADSKSSGLEKSIHEGLSKSFNSIHVFFNFPQAQRFMDHYNFKWVEPDTSDDNLFEVDDLLRPSFDFFSKLEVRCLAECCGIDAFSFDPEDIEKASKDLNKNALIENLESAMIEMEKRIEKTVISSRLNNLFDKVTFIQLLGHAVTVLRRIK